MRRKNSFSWDPFEGPDPRMNPLLCACFGCSVIWKKGHASHDYNDFHSCSFSLLAALSYLLKVITCSGWYCYLRRWLVWSGTFMWPAPPQCLRGFAARKVQIGGKGFYTPFNGRQRSVAPVSLSEAEMELTAECLLGRLQPFIYLLTCPPLSSRHKTTTSLSVVWSFPSWFPSEKWLTVTSVSVCVDITLSSSEVLDALFVNMLISTGTALHMICDRKWSRAMTAPSPERAQFSGSQPFSSQPKKETCSFSYKAESMTVQSHELWQQT